MERIAWNHGEKLTYLKEKHKLTQSDIGRIMGCGPIHARNYMINDVQTIPKYRLDKLLDAFGISSFDEVIIEKPAKIEVDENDITPDNFTDELRITEFVLVNIEGLKEAIRNSPYSQIKLGRALGVSASAIGNIIYRGNGSRYFGLLVEKLCKILDIPVTPYFTPARDRKIVNIPEAFREELIRLENIVGRNKLEAIYTNNDALSQTNRVDTEPINVSSTDSEDDDIDISGEELNAFKANMEDKEVEPVYVESSPSKSQTLYDPQEKRSISTVLSNIQKNLQDIHFSPEQMKSILESIQNIASGYTYEQVMDKVDYMKRQHIFPADKDNNLILMELLDDIITDESAERYNYSIALRIKDRRAERYVSIDELATEVGITIAKLRQYESGNVNIPYNIIYKIAACLNTTAEYIITGRGEKESW